MTDDDGSLTPFALSDEAVTVCVGVPGPYTAAAYQVSDGSMALRLLSALAEEHATGRPTR